MFAQVKADTRFASVTACSGIHFTKHAVTFVPAGFEEEVMRNPYLEIVPDTEINPQEETLAEEPKPKRGRRSK